MNELQRRGMDSVGGEPDPRTNNYGCRLLLRTNIFENSSGNFAFDAPPRTRGKEERAEVGRRIRRSGGFRPADANLFRLARETDRTAAVAIVNQTEDVWRPDTAGKVEPKAEQEQKSYARGPGWLYPLGPRGGGQINSRMGKTSKSIETTGFGFERTSYPILPSRNSSSPPRTERNG
ncbi:Hypothetical protein NTJ_02142 [Nesidiocoris tenuis]|uniref:Uncharacterized protein n=1 Tax=Nesidiocoris tenuis TaxID=355587 RepID=A0ABN7AAI5_9HEMI|nr:Hypothetical protein NTJ_02142 [Nesidiocoris tenuis]